VSAANQGAFNVANAVGAALGALVISSGLGYTAPMWVGAVLALVGAGIAVLARSADRRSVRAPEPLPSRALPRAEMVRDAA
jgi:DHA1 family inner membrane transport protein